MDHIISINILRLFNMQHASTRHSNRMGAVFVLSLEMNEKNMIIAAYFLNNDGRPLPAQ